MKRIKRIFKEDKDTFLKEISNLRTKETGLSKGILSISTKEGNQNPRVKLYRGRPGEDKPFASITINGVPAKAYVRNANLT